MKIGTIAPDFLLYDQYGDPFRLYDNLQQNVILIFYPKDFTSVCTSQLKSYSEKIDSIINAVLLPVAINIAANESHKRFAEKNSLKLRILSDEKRNVSKLYNAINFIGINKRKIVMVDKSRTIIYSKTSLPFNYIPVEKLLEVN